MKSFNLATASVNTTPFDLEGNSAIISDAIQDAASKGANLVLLPELALSGYGCEDVFYVQAFLEEIPAYLKKVMDEIPDGVLAAIGLPLFFKGRLFNACALVSNKEVYGMSLKKFLACRGIHYESRWFSAWPEGEADFLPVGWLPGSIDSIPVGDLVYSMGGTLRIGCEICEDAWVADRPGRRLAASAANVILNPSASHFAIGKKDVRRDLAVEGSRAFRCAYAYVNLLGNESGRSIFDGESIIASDGCVLSRGDLMSFAPFETRVAEIDLEECLNASMGSSEPFKAQTDEYPNEIEIPCVFSLKTEPGASKKIFSERPQPSSPQSEEEIDIVNSCRAVALGMWDFMRKTRTSGFALSLSGGADSALCAAMVAYGATQAAYALGPNKTAATLKECGIDTAMPAAGETIDHWIRNAVMPKLLVTMYQGSEHSGSVTFNAAKSLARGIGCTHHAVSIAPLVKDYTDLINGLLPEDGKLCWEKDDLTLQNIQARSRAPSIWMLANKTNKLLIATSNLSEAVVGYCTMDGDTAGVLSPIAGIGKSRILKINAYIAKCGLPVGKSDESFTLPEMQLIVDQRPTAELRPVEQTDEGDLMPYPLLDEIRQLAHVKNLWPRDILSKLCAGPFAETFSPKELAAYIRRFYRLWSRNQWKRERIAVGFHIEKDSADPKAFRRFPVLSGSMEPRLKAMDELAEKLSKG